MSSEQDKTIFHVTEQYVTEVEAGKQPRLSDYLARYPQYADAIVDFVVHYHATNTSIQEEEKTSDRTQMHTPPPLSALSRVALERARKRVVTPTITTLLLAREKQSLSLSQLANALNLSTDIVIVLEQRQIDSRTLPQEVFRRLSSTLQQPIIALESYFTSPPQEQPSSTDPTAYRSTRVAESPNVYPTPPEEHLNSKPLKSFRQLVQESQQLSYSHKAMWKAILDQENL